jgi:hypothetical protein
VIQSDPLKKLNNWFAINYANLVIRVIHIFRWITASRLRRCETTNTTLSIRFPNKKIPLPYNSQGVPCFGKIKQVANCFNQTERQAEIKPIVLS